MKLIATERFVSATDQAPPGMTGTRVSVNVKVELSFNYRMQISSLPSTTPNSSSQSNAQGAPAAPTSGVVIEIKPGESNVSEGNRSQNTLEVSISTAARQLSTEVTREQAIAGVEQRIQKKAVKQALGGPSIVGGSNPLLLVAAKSGEVGNGELKDLGGALYQRKVAQTYLSIYQNGISSGNGNSSSNSPASSGVELASQASNAYIKHTLFFATVDKFA